MKTRAENIKIIEDRILSIVHHFGIETFANHYINGGIAIFSRYVKRYYNLDKMRDEKIDHFGLLGNGYFQLSIGFNCDKYEQLKKKNVKFKDDDIRQLIFLTNESFGDCNAKYDQLHHEDIYKRILPDDLVEEIANFMLDYDDANACGERFYKWVSKWFKGHKYAKHLAWNETLEIDEMPTYIKETNETYFRIRHYNIDKTYQSGIYDLEHYPILDKHGKVNDKWRYFVPA
ncbi:MAG: hypothetical protein [Wendovervirus sonii]|uniref:Uncharacterized protein n=1 Tax=phage Lak_Megaphage_Sonny TaxID=3109229 RepID=A0ABZ0Z2V2_9CAUD|nr:MAG: hypothetical protein [phage Lak_Megaphage_Sonny]